jgi:iron complex outermembrane receptor protein
MHREFSYIKRTITALGLVLIVQPLLAQQVLEEITVTAQKRAENLQDVPIAVSAFDKDALTDRGFESVSDLSQMVPSLQVGNFGPVAFVAMRGIGMENTTAGGDPGVALHVDGVYIGRPVGTLFNAFDMERVEVLRGPQGTLYGRNATGGSINLITRKPSQEFEGEVQGTYGNYNMRRVRGFVNTPLSDTVAARVVGYVEKREGFTKNSVPGGTEANDLDGWGLRGHLSFDLGESGSLLLSGTHVDSGGVGTQPEVREAYPDRLAGPPIPGTVDYILNGVQLVNDLRPFREAKDTHEKTDNSFTLVSATLEWDFQNVTFKSITAYEETEFFTLQDDDSSEKALADLQLTETAEQFSQEFQLLSNTDSALRWILGAYFFNEEAERFSTFFKSRYDIIAAINGTEAGVKLGGDIETTSWALFGQGIYDINDEWAMTLGLRYTDDDKEGTNRNILFGPLFIDPVQTDSQEVTGKLAFDWKFSDSAMAYASYAHGYKSGGINQVAIVSAGRNPVYDPEFVDAYEIGVKSRLFNDRMQLNAAVYYNDYQDLQFQIFENAGPAAGNADKATVVGLELELQALLSDNWTMDGTLGLTDSEYDDLVFGALDASGNELTRTPEVTWNLGFTGAWDLSAGSTLRWRIEGAYTDTIWYAFANRIDPAMAGNDQADSYYNFNTRLFWTSPSGKFTAEAYVTNLTDEVQEGNILRGIGFQDCGGCGGQEFITYNPPRQYGLTLGYRF